MIYIAWQSQMTQMNGKYEADDVNNMQVPDYLNNCAVTDGRFQMTQMTSRYQMTRMSCKSILNRLKYFLVLCSCKVCKVPLVSGMLGALYKLVDNNNNNK